MAETDSGAYTPETISRRQKMAELLLSESLKPQKITHWAEGLAQLGRAGVGGYIAGEAEREQKAGEAKSRDFMANLLMGGGGASPAAPVMPPVTPGAVPNPDPAAAISSIESGGKYDALGPVTKDGDRAYGRYQVMGANVPQWTKAHLGTEMTPEQFLQNPEAQDAVFKGQFGNYSNKYGPVGAAKAWFAGERGMNNSNARDVLGTSVSDYAGKFAKALGFNGDPSDNSQLPANARPTQALAPDAPSPMDTAQYPAGPVGAPQSQRIAQALQSGAVEAPPPAANGAPPNPMADKIAQALRSNDPYIAKAAQGLAGGLITKQFTPPKYHKLNDEQLFDEGTGAVKAAGPGFKPLVDPKERAQFGIPPEDKRPYQLGPGNKLINPPPETRLNIDQRNEAAFEQASGKHQAERFDKLVSGGMEAKAMTADLGALKDIGSRITTGKTAEIQAAIGPYAEALGVKMDGLDDLQAYKSIVAKLAPRMRVVGSGATSDYEMRQFLEALPGLGKTQGGNEMIQTTLQALQDHKEGAAEIASKAMNKELTPREADKMLRELPDPLTAWKKAKGVTTLQATPKGSSVEDLLKKYAK